MPKKEELCIMPPSPVYSCVRFPGAHRHEIFFGPYRKKSIKYGLVCFLTPEKHNGSSEGVHFNREFDLELKRLAQHTAMEYYGWTVEKFREEFGKNYLEE